MAESSESREKDSTKKYTRRKIIGGILEGTVLAGGVGVVGWPLLKKIYSLYVQSKQTKAEKVGLPQIAKETEQLERCINALYENPTSGTALYAKRAAQRSWLIIYLYSADFSESKRAEILNSFISNTERGLEGLKLLKGRYDQEMYLYTDDFERYRSCARIVLNEGPRIVLNEGPYSPRLEKRLNNIIEFTLDEQKSAWHKMVKSYADIGQHSYDIAAATFDPNIAASLSNQAK